MIVTFLKMMCNTCQKVRWHEKVVTPCCVHCQEYNLQHLDTPTNDGANAPMQIERFI